LVVLAFVCIAPAPLSAQWTFDIEAGVADNPYNDIRIPGTTGTKFSLTDDFEDDMGGFWRLRVERQLGDRHTLSLLIAPLRLEAAGINRSDLTFTDVTFPAGTALDILYRFDSYRLTYLYGIHRRPNLRISAGVTAKIRDAEIRVSSPLTVATKTNTGFVPLLHARLEFDISQRVTALLDADALAAPQGRAEDVLAAVMVRIAKSAQLRAGYRFLEGGADNDDVYSFAMINYFLLGLTITR
jgi:hypothetical protein